MCLKNFINTAIIPQFMSSTTIDERTRDIPNVLKGRGWSASDKVIHLDKSHALGVNPADYSPLGTSGRVKIDLRYYEVRRYTPPKDGTIAGEDGPQCSVEYLVAASPDSRAGQLEIIARRFLGRNRSKWWNMFFNERHFYGFAAADIQKKIDAKDTKYDEKDVIYLRLREIEATHDYVNNQKTLFPERPIQFGHLNNLVKSFV